MKQFDIYQHADGRLEAIKQGWNWPAFFLGTFWALYCRLWRIAALTLAGILTISVAGAMEESGLLDMVVNVICLGVYTVFGLYGNRWKRRLLIASGGRFRATVRAAGRREAIERHAGDAPSGAPDSNEHTFQA
ncbi:DUF2628 domain-containing protein [Kushneria sp. AK178]